MVTLAKKRIKNVFNDSMENIRKGKSPNISSAMKKEGYSESSCRALKVKKTKTWENLLKSVDDEIILKKIYEILQGDDMRSSLTSADMLLKLKDKYPAQKSKVMGLFQAIDDLKDEH